MIVRKEGSGLHPLILATTIPTETELTEGAVSAVRLVFRRRRAAEAFLEVDLTGDEWTLSGQTLTTTWYDVAGALVAGEYEAEVQIFDNDDAKLVAPSEGYVLLEVQPSFVVQGS
jgi:hypothetical protein